MLDLAADVVERRAPNFAASKRIPAGEYFHLRSRRLRHPALGDPLAGDASRDPRQAVRPGAKVVDLGQHDLTGYHAAQRTAGCRLGIVKRNVTSGHLTCSIFFPLSGTLKPAPRSIFFAKSVMSVHQCTTTSA